MVFLLHPYIGRKQNKMFDKNMLLDYIEKIKAWLTPQNINLMSSKKSNRKISAFVTYN